ncbi:23944_t:CDS:2 [Gigaspora margarita]|uniref:23944_t:CDS:1 n=1 Tax=Gigaspora margarita TaxID=4874 RepID=A0ABN7V9G7_GIGMA|nr:23944_t:CDS:2 [Gigaspora margarita]
MSIQNHKRQLLALGTIDQKLHYGPFATNWWVFSKLKTNQNKKSIPIHINMRIKFELNQKEFIIRVVDNNWKPGYVCELDTEAIVYLIFSFDNKVVAEQLRTEILFFLFQITVYDITIFVAALGSSDQAEWNFADIYYQENKIYTYSGKSPNDVWAKSTIQTHITVPYYKACNWNNIEIMAHAFEKHLKRRILVVNLDWYQYFTKWKQQSTTIIEFSSYLASIYLADFLEFWTCAEDPSSDHASILYLYTKNLLNDIPYDLLQLELSIVNKNSQNKIVHAIKRYIRIEHNLNEGKKIQTAITDLEGTSVANLEPIHDNHHVKKIASITQLFYFEWPTDNDYTGYIKARYLPHIGPCTQFLPFEISKLITIPINKPTPNITPHSIPKKP